MREKAPPPTWEGELMTNIPAKRAEGVAFAQGVLTGILAGLEEGSRKARAVDAAIRNLKDVREDMWLGIRS